MAAEPRYQRLDFTLKELTLPGAAEDAVPGSSSTLELRDRKLVCVEYPAVVHNTDKMLDTLGGEQAVSKTFVDPNRRLELRFRPQDPFCHSACGNRLSSSNILLRVRRRVRRKDPKDAEIQMDIVGIIGTTYKFQGLADFQYLAVDSQGGTHTSLYDRIILRQTETQEFFEQPVPYFLPPVIFSRLDNPMDYFYRAEAHQTPQTYANKNSIGLNRARRPHNAIFVSFNDAVVPTECLEGARLNWARCCLKDNDRLAEEQIKKMFESRPIWSKNAVKANINFQILTPHNKGLIRRAISQSGVALCPWAVNHNPRKFAEEVALRVNCPTDSRMAACLKMTDPITLTKAGTIHLSGSPDQPIVNNLILSPVIDGDFLPDEPSNLFHNAAEVDYIAGANDMDGHIFTGLDVPSVNNDIVETPIEDVKRLLGALTKEKGQLGLENAYSTYSSDWGSNPSWQKVKQTVVAIETDYIFLIPTQTALYLHAEKATTGRTYSYLFSEPNRMGGLIAPFPIWMGADHADDLQYVFGKPFSTPLGYWPRHRDVSSYMIAYWTNFAKTGDPNSGDLKVPVAWPKFQNTDHKFLEINAKTNSESVNEMLRLRYVHFWASVFPKLPSQ